MYGVCLTADEPLRVIASAGTHVELDGGVTVAALDASTGRPAWKKHLRKPPSKVPPGGKGGADRGLQLHQQRAPYRERPDRPWRRRAQGGRFAFAPDDDERTLNERLASPKR